MGTKTRTGHLYKRGRRFYVQWRVNGRTFTKALKHEDGTPITVKREAELEKERFMSTFAHASEAEALQNIAAKLEGRKAELAKLEDERNPPVSVAQAWAAYIASPNRPDSGKSTLRQYEFQYEALAKWAGEEKPEAKFLRDVTPDIAEEYATHLTSSGLSPNTYNKHLNLLTLVWRVLKAKARLNGAGNPWEEIPRKRLATQSRRELTIDELRTICQKAKGEMRVLLALGIYAGLRLGDAATLHWGEVDLQRRIIRRVPNKTARRNPKPIVIPIHEVLWNMLNELPKASHGTNVLPQTAELYRGRIDAVTDRIQKHFRDCKIKTIKEKTGTDSRAVVEVGFHSLRHSFVSLCRMSNAPLAVVEAIVGHANPAMTRHYTHVGELAAGQAVDALPDVTTKTKRRKEPDSPEAVLKKARRLVQQMSGKNWAAKRTRLLELLAKA